MGKGDILPREVLSPVSLETNAIVMLCDGHKKSAEGIVPKI